MRPASAPCALLVLAAAGCGGAPVAMAPPTGTATLTFSVSKTARTSPALTSPLVGAIYGALFHTSDTTLSGPNKGAVAVASVEMPGVDLRAEGAVSMPWTSPALEPDGYIFLGMFDVNGNAAASDASPDNGDPVTLPIDKFDVEGGKDTRYAVAFDVVYNM